MNPVEDNTAVIAEIRSLAETVCTGSITPEQCGRLNSLLLDEKAALTYAVYIRMHGLLCWHWQDQIVVIETPETPPPAQLPAGLLGGAWQGTVGFFSQTMPFSYLTATVILGVMLLGFWAYKITHHQHIAEAPSQSVPSDAMPEMVFVGRITGMLDVKWSDDPGYLPPLSSRAYVPLGREYKLDSGLMEITYDSGAKVILEGPCTYEVESTAGGYLALGKLTAKVETRGEGRGARGEDVSHYPLSTTHYPLFSVRTPTAVVTDLGTEFGVEVSDEGTTESCVFRGSVRVQVVGDSLPSLSGRGVGGEGSGREVILRENESARVEGRGKPRVTVLGASAKTADFTRRIPKVTYKTLDLVDVVAGGDGFSGRRDRGIDPTSGLAVATASNDHFDGNGDGQYHRVEALPLVDGVFIPDGRSGPVRVDSAGHTFAGFPDTANATWKPVWAGGVVPADPPSTAFLGGIDYASPPHCLLFMHANNGITFDLEAIRRANPGTRLLRFRAVAGNSSEAMYSPNGVKVSADLWVLVDGQVRFERREVNGYSGAFPVSISIGDDDRFLTLATTDGDGTDNKYDDFFGDWTMFGDPRLDLMQVDANEPKDKGGGDG